MKNVYQIENGTAIPQTDKSAFHAAGQAFSVSRQTGEVIGQPYSLNPKQGWERFSLVDRGSAAQAFKLLAISPGPYVNVVYLAIKEFETGPLKTFVYYDNFSVVTGSCE